MFTLSSQLARNQENNGNRETEMPGTCIHGVPVCTSLLHVCTVPSTTCTFSCPLPPITDKPHHAPVPMPGTTSPQNAQGAPLFPSLSIAFFSLYLFCLPYSFSILKIVAENDRDETLPPDDKENPLNKEMKPLSPCDTKMVHAS